MKKHLSAIFVVLLLLIGVYIVGHRVHSAVNLTPKSQSNTTNSSSKPQSVATFNKSKYSLSDPASIWVVVDKRRPLNPKTYAPSLATPTVALKGSATAENMHVSTQMAPALEQLFAAAKQAGYPLRLSSGYRSYSYQVSVYNNEAKQNGASGADQESARPGYSEHQTGLAADVSPLSGTCDLEQCFGNTPTGQWLAGNAYRYGFIIRYPEGKQAITGYEYEPWHIRYVGTGLSNEMHKEGILTLEEFFGLPAAAAYP